MKVLLGRFDAEYGADQVCIPCHAPVEVHYGGRVQIDACGRSKGHGGIHALSPASKAEAETWFAKREVTG